MASAAANVLAKGPLSSALGQYLFLGFGTFVIFTGDNGVSRAAQQLAGVAFRLATGRDAGGEVEKLLREAALGNSAANNAGANALRNAGGQQAQQPIVIHSHGPSSDGTSGWTMSIIRLTLASGGLWGAYIIFSNYLPDNIKEMMPVTRKFFESAVSSLGNGILRVRDVLSEQIAVLGHKQDELSAKQDETYDKVLGLKDDIGDVRVNLDDIAGAISRCEGSLTDAAGRQTYMSRGMRLLVQCVGDLLRPSDPAVAEELERFSRMSMEMDGDEGGSRSNTRRGRGGLEYPSSPNLSEIGSTTSASVDEHLHQMRSLSLPRPRQAQPIVTPSSSANQSVAPGRMPLMSTPPSLRMLSSFNGTTGNGNNISRPSSSSKLSRSYSSPEDEVPQSNGYTSYNSSGQSTPHESRVGELTNQLKLDELEGLMGQMAPNGGGSRMNSIRA